MLQAHVPHWHELLHVCVPLVSQDCVAPATQAPPPVHADQAPHVPSLLHVRLCVPVPQLPHASDAAPLHVQTPAWHADPAAQAWAHAPQLLVSVIRFALQPSLGTPSQFAYPLVQLPMTHAPPAHDWTAPPVVLHDDVQLPQWPTVSLVSVSHPSDALLLQSPQPVLHVATVHT